MFTGIVQECGEIKEITRQKSGLCVLVACRKISPKPGDSVAINGVCLTATSRSKGKFFVDVIAETLAKTTLGTLKVGAKVNLEPAAKLSDALNGHLVYGHVDGTLTVLGKSHELLTLQLAPALKPFIAEKGSITLDGVALTVAKKTKISFTVALTPYTLAHTTLGSIHSGDRLNYEIDPVARYLYNFTQV